MMLREVKCNLCGSSRNVVVYEAAMGQEGGRQRPYCVTRGDVSPPGKIVRCSNCGLIFAPPREDFQTLLSDYREMVDETYVREEVGRRKAACTVIKKLNKFRRYGSRLLDVGCCTGFLLDEARKMGWDVYGVEPSRWAARYAKEKLHLEVYNSTLKEAKLPSNSFNAVVMQDTIEHLPFPKEALIEIRRILAPNGILYINTPDIASLASRLLKAKWWGINQFHLYYFSKKTLNKLLEAAGFKSIQHASHPRVFTLRYWLERFKRYNRFIYSVLTFLTRVDNLENRLLRVNLHDQIGVLARKIRRLEYLDELEKEAPAGAEKKLKTIVVLPAYNAAKTLRSTYQAIPKDVVDEIILVDDCSEDTTVEIAERLGLKVFVHDRNRGYGANQKTCYTKALEMGADVVVMVHPDYQYDPRVIPDLITPIKNRHADAVFGSRMMQGGALMGGMPPWKHNANIFLTAVENIILKTYLSEYHSGFRAYSAKLLKTVRFIDNSDGFIFDTEIIVQALAHYFKIIEIPISTRYFDEASTITLWPSILYGLGILKTLLKYVLHDHHIKLFKQFE